MRYAQGGGLDAAVRDRREQVRMAAAEFIAAGESDEQVARRFRVAKMAADRWRRALAAGGTAALASTGAAGARPLLTEVQRCELSRRPGDEKVLARPGPLDASRGQRGLLGLPAWSKGRQRLVVVPRISWVAVLRCCTALTFQTSPASPFGLTEPATRSRSSLDASISAINRSRGDSATAAPTDEPPTDNWPATWAQRSERLHAIAVL
uniref:Transposase n=1 Tax=Streptomyces avermitilis TaxID=33903 RepID=A0A499V1N6_STRAX|nr:hypothetical protein SAVMC3_08030 [Streptomyces avermitilis]